MNPLTINVKIIDGAALRAITTEQMRTYIKAHGWKYIGPLHDVAELWRHKTHESLLPLHPDLGDYAIRMQEFLVECAEIEKRGQLEIYLDIIGWKPEVVLTIEEDALNVYSNISDLKVKHYALFELESPQPLIYGDAMSVIVTETPDRTAREALIAEYGDNFYEQNNSVEEE